MLDPNVNSLAYLHTLLIHARSRPGREAESVPGYLCIAPSERLWSKMVGFLGSFDKRQIRYAGSEWRKVIEIVAESAKKTGQVRDPRSS
jgi:COP9 signalosome complex subunit 3